MVQAKEFLEKVNFKSRSKEELSKINSGKNENKSSGAKMRWLKHKNPMVASLMSAYKTGNKIEAVELYCEDIERVNNLLKECKTVDEKLKVISKHNDIIGKSNEFIFGTKSKREITADINLDLKAKDLAERVLERLKNNGKETKTD